jgi:hypothetical protein
METRVETGTASQVAAGRVGRGIGERGGVAHAATGLKVVVADAHALAAGAAHIRGGRERLRRWDRVARPLLRSALPAQARVESLRQRCRLEQQLEQKNWQSPFDHLPRARISKFADVTDRLSRLSPGPLAGRLGGSL